MHVDDVVIPEPLPERLQLALRSGWSGWVAALVVDLERGVLDVEVVVEQRVDGPSGGVAVGVGVDQDVRGQGWESGGDFPDVEVVNLDDAWLAGERSADLVRVDALGGGLEEDPGGGLHQRGAGADHQPGDQQ